MSKKSLPATVSLVFAEPEQGAKLDSALARLPPVLQKASESNESLMPKRDRVDSDSSSDNQLCSIGTTEETVKRARTDDDVNVVLSAAPSGGVTQGNESTNVISTGACTDVCEPSMVLEPEAIVAPLLPPPPKISETTAPVSPTSSTSITPSSNQTPESTKITQASTSTSWFRSYSKSKARKKSTLLIVENNEPCTEKTPADHTDSQRLFTANATTTATASSDKQLAHEAATLPDAPMSVTQPQDIPMPEVSPSISSDPSIPTSTIPSSLPQHSNPAVTSMSSVDEEAPRLPTVKLPPTSSACTHDIRNTPGTKTSLNTLHPNTSRFTLSIPLLGRPKIPLEQAVAAAQHEDIRAPELPQVSRSITPPPEMLASNGDEGQVTETAPQVAIALPAATPELAATSPDIVQPQESLPDGHWVNTTETPSKPWWGYLGWSTSEVVPSTPDESSKEAVGSQSTDHDAITSANEPREGLTTDQATDARVSVDNKPDPDQGASLDASVQAPSEELRPVPSDTDTSQTEGTTWYTPWSWYPSSTTKLTQQELPEQTVPAKEDDTKPEPVRVEAEASSRVDDGGPEVSAPLVGHNPIQSTIATNPSGWMLFFSSRALTTKRITSAGESDENGMEVMNLDEDHTEVKAQSVVQAVSTKETNKLVIDSSKHLASPSSKKPSSPSNPPNIDHMKQELSKRQPSPTPSKKSAVKTPISSPPPPNLILPTWSDTFNSKPRSVVPPPPASALTKTFQYVSGVLFAREDDAHKKGKGKAKEVHSNDFGGDFGKALPRAWDVLDGQIDADILKGCKKVVVIGVHGWFPGAVMRTVIGEPTGTSTKFVNMMVQALDVFQEKHHVKLEKITKIPLEGEGTINGRVEKLYQNLIQNEDWMKDLREADAIFVATHSQGCIVSTHLLDRLVTDRHIRTFHNVDVLDAAGPLASGSMDIIPSQQPQRVCCLALCGVHLGPLRYLSTSSLLQPYIQYFESIAARELFEFQNTESQTSQDYVKSLRNVLHHRIKMVYVASLNDQVVGVYSGLFTSVNHPLILRALYIDGDAYHSSDFLSNLLVLLLRIRNSGLSDSGLITHLSESTAGSLNGVGHSTAYEELATYSLAVNYLFLTDNGLEQQTEMEFEPFNALTERNDYEIPWALRDLVADERVAHFFSDEFVRLRDAFRDWQPKTAILRDVKRKLQPIQRLSSAMITPYSNSISKL